MVVLLSAEKRVPAEAFTRLNWSAQLDKRPAIVTALAPGGEPTHTTVRFRWLRWP